MTPFCLLTRSARLLVSGRISNNHERRRGIPADDSAQFITPPQYRRLDC